MNDTSEQDRRALDQLGDALHAAAIEDLGSADARAAQHAHDGERVRADGRSGASRPTPARRVARRPRRRRTLVAAAVVALIAVPGVAIAASALIGEDEVARSIPNGTLALLGTNPACTTVREGIEFDCTLARAPQGELEPGAWKATVEPTVDDAKRVNGGCRSLNAEGTHWRCYVGREAIRQQIIGPALLGQYAPSPGVG